MKTTNNAQKTDKGLVRKMIGRGTAVIISLVLLSWSVGAQNFWDRVLIGYESNRLALSVFENSSVNEENLPATGTINFEEAAPVLNSNEAAFGTIEAELENQVEEYQSSEYVEAEIAAETEKWMNSNNETIETELTLPVIEYNPDVFVEAELNNETENVITSNIEDAYEALEAELENSIKFNAADFVQAELDAETEIWMTGNSEYNEAELVLPAFDYNPDQFVDAELAAERENQLNDDNGASSEFDAKKLEQNLKFNVEEYVEADMATETENWLK
jgi:hypothetical protein